MIGNSDVFEALADEYRRQLLIDLLACRSLSVPPLTGISREIATSDEQLLYEHLSSGRTIAGADEQLLRKRHVHLPMLVDCGFVEWDREADVVTRGPRFDDVRPVLELLADRREPAPVVTVRR